MNKELLAQTAKQMVAKGKGILAMDESHGTCEKRFVPLGIEFNETNRQKYRSMLVTTPGLGDYISGAILFDETIRQSTVSGIPIPKALEAQKILPGIKVDEGKEELALHPGEEVTKGLDNLRKRLVEYKLLGAKFAKWRAVVAIDIENGLPSNALLMANMHGLARYAALCQEADIVPMVEPEVLINGNHSIDEAYHVTKKTLKVLFEQLSEQGVYLEGTILKTSMVISAKNAEQRATVQEVADKTVQCFKEVIPENLAGIVFLSGGQTWLESIQHLNAMNVANRNLPWPLSFSYGRALQEPPLNAWAKNQNDIETPQKYLYHRAKCNGLATLGEYSEEIEGEMNY